MERAAGRRAVEITAGRMGWGRCEQKGADGPRELFGAGLRLCACRGSVVIGGWVEAVGDKDGCTTDGQGPSAVSSLGGVVGEKSRCGCHGKGVCRAKAKK